MAVNIINVAIKWDNTQFSLQNQNEHIYIYVFVCL